MIISRFQRSETFNWSQPGPLAQAITFRAFGAEKLKDYRT